jgi:hypothetical protein
MRVDRQNKKIQMRGWQAGRVGWVIGWLIEMDDEGGGLRFHRGVLPRSGSGRQGGVFQLLLTGVASPQKRLQGRISCWYLINLESQNLLFGFAASLRSCQVGKIKEKLPCWNVAITSPQEKLRVQVFPWTALQQWNS